MSSYYVRCWGVNGEQGKCGPYHHLAFLVEGENAFKSQEGIYRKMIRVVSCPVSWRRLSTNCPVLSVFLLLMSNPTGGEGVEEKCFGWEVRKELEPTLMV